MFGATPEKALASMNKLVEVFKSLPKEEQDVCSAKFAQAFFEANP